MFKAGSKARVVREAYSKSLPYSPLPIGPGDVVTVRDDGIDPDGDVACYTEAGKAIWPAASCLEPVEDEATDASPRTPQSVRAEALAAAVAAYAEITKDYSSLHAIDDDSDEDDDIALVLRLARYIETGAVDA